MAKVRVRVPKTVKKGEVFEVKTLIPHKMESGHRTDPETGKKIPQMIINAFTCTYNGRDVFSNTWYSAISANPYLAFYVKAGDSGVLEMTWTDDSGAVFKKSAKITVA